VAGGEEIEEAEVTEDLQLLADFVADVQLAHHLLELREGDSP